jgi:outer membrane protein assembly factor BamB
MSSPPPRRRRGLLVALVAVVLLAGGAAAFLAFRQPGDVSNPDVEFEAPTTATTAPEPKPKPKVDDFLWPTYGFDAARTRDFGDAPDYLRPPFRRGWTYRGPVLIEFPPAIRGSTLYLLDDDAMLRAIQKTSGRILWRQQVGRLAAASPTVGDGRVYAVALRGIDSEAGRIAAYDARTGRQAWSHALPSRAESSPLLRRGVVYFGSEDGTVYALDARSGKTRWTYAAGNAVKGGLAYAKGTLYFGDYGGRVHAVRTRDGSRVWSVGTSGTRFGFGSGRFYSTAAVAFGRVYLGNTDSRVYSFSARTGELAWATGTGSYVYGSPAVANVDGLGPTVYIGSYDGNFYAFDARSGSVRWRFASGAKISGSATIVGDVVYFSNLGATITEGLDVRTGRKLFDFSDGAFNAVVADRRALYFAGYTSLYEMLPARKSPEWRQAQAAAVETARREGRASPENR